MAFTSDEYSSPDNRWLTVRLNVAGKSKGPFQFELRHLTQIETARRTALKTSIGSTVSVGGFVIGTVSANGVLGNNLVVDLNGNSTPPRVSTLLQALTYSNTNNATPSLLQRTISVSVNDGLGGVDSEKSSMRAAHV